MSTVAQVETLYQDVVAKLQRISDSNDVPFAQRRAAREALADLVLAHANDAVQRIEGRTAILTALIGRLEGVISQVKVNPIGDALDSLNGVLTRARAIADDVNELKR